MLQIKLDALQSKARRLLRPGRIVTLPWGRGSGKTFFDRICIHEWALENPGTHVGLLLPTLKQARAVFWPHLLADYYGPLRPFVKRPNVTELSCEYRNGSRLTTWGAENANTIRGQRFSRLVEDEADDIDPDVERAVVEPTFSKSGTKAIWLKTGTPKRGRYGILYLGYRRGQEGTPERQKLINEGLDPSVYVSLRFPSRLSPQVDQVWLDRTMKDLRASGRWTTWLREYEVEFDAAEGLVYSDFEQGEHGLHVREPAPGTIWSEILVGIDHGYEDPQVFLVIGVIGSGRDATLWVIEEYYETHRQHTELQAKARDIKERYGQLAPVRAFADPSRPDMIAMYRSIGLWVEPAKNAIDDGVGAVADRLAPREMEVDGETVRYARLYVSPSCVNTIEEMGKYRRKRDPKDNDRVLDQIEDKNNHAMDALRYPVFSRFGGPPTMIKQEDPYGGDEG